MNPQCEKFIWEAENYIKDDKGRIPKMNDHLLDDFRYFLDAAGFEFKNVVPPKEKDPDMERRAYKIEDDFSFEGSLEEI